MYPHSRPAIVRLQQALADGRPIEVEIGKLYQAASHGDERARHLPAFRFYLNDLISAIASEW